MLHYRTITAADDAALAKIIRTNLEQLQLDIPGTAYFDPELDHMSQYYAKAPEKRAYFIALDETALAWPSLRPFPAARRYRSCIWQIRPRERATARR